MTADEAAHRRRLAAIVRADPDLMRLLDAARSLALPQWRLVAGCLYQTVWNALTGRPRRHGIRDYDLIYFDSDTSWEAEDAVLRRAAPALAACIGPVEIRNQARVHFWFEARFGSPYPPVASADAALARYAAVVHAVGVRLEPDDTLTIAAPFGLSDLFGLVVRANPVLANRPAYEAKAARMRALWPELTVLPWPEAPADAVKCADDTAAVSTGLSPGPSPLSTSR
ncbi:nucleotidyltransferase family protein [Methylobacterium nonmethylotrophicum]|uniref:Nucleotidyltransferase family protein n=1 Tax=Methylobacterium nonmethylotrophicum TaxID=1141884 RepID=A0A4Z0NMZ9_9HYPH|nr:nucleotidyltransferase family protein [Methylobacterium nonmethylotrophicum]TGD96958.1 nucleotidyltransferase family protein [Methylobacterium nonmethylotrophicum]